MLERLFISKVRLKLLRQYLFNPEEEYHVRGLVRLLGEEINAIRRELQNLEKAGILVSHASGNRLVYKVDESCAFLSELRSMFYKDSDDIECFLNLRTKVPGIEIALLTVNFLNKKYETDQDIDLLFVGTIDIRELSVEMKNIERELGRELRYAVLTNQDLEFRKKKRDQFLLNILGKDKILLIGSDNKLVC